MQATINANQFATFRPRLTAVSMYSISGFDVARCAQNFRLSDSSLLIRFNDTTSLDVLTDLASPLPEESLGFRNQTKLLGLANTNTQLPALCYIFAVMCHFESIRLSSCFFPRDRFNYTISLAASVTTPLHDSTFGLNTEDFPRTCSLSPGFFPRPVVGGTAVHRACSSDNRKTFEQWRIFTSNTTDDLRRELLKIFWKQGVLYCVLLKLSPFSSCYCTEKRFFRLLDL
ncbi:hypothetical protein YC2023_009477 [Brassica napus]